MGRGSWWILSPQAWHEPLLGWWEVLDGSWQAFTGGTEYRTRKGDGEDNRLVGDYLRRECVRVVRDMGYAPCYYGTREDAFSLRLGPQREPRDDNAQMSGNSRFLGDSLRKDSAGMC